MKNIILVFFLLFSVAVHADFKVIQVDKFINHTALELKRNTLAIEKIREMAFDKCFEKEFLARKLIQTNGKTNQQILDEIRKSQITVNLKMYKSFKNTVGYTYPNDSTLYLNRKFHNHMGQCDVGSNIFHEDAHKLGFGHDFRANYQRQFSVPYSINFVMGKCCTDNKL